MTDSTHAFLSAPAVTLIRAAYNADDQAANKWVKAKDIMIAEGVTHTMLSEDDGLRTWFKANVIKPTMTKDEQALMALSKAGAKALSVERKAARRLAIQNMGSKLSKVIKHLTPKAEKADTGDTDTGDTDTGDTGDTVEVATADKLRKDLSAWIVRLQKSEGLEGLNVVAMIKALNAAIKLIN